MKPRWDDVNARARGLGTRLLDPERLSSLASSTSLSELVAALEREGHPFLSKGTAPTPFDLERGFRRTVARHLEILTRWCGARSRVLLFLFEDEDRRNLRSLVRGAVAGAPQERRLSGLLPTPALPERALEELSRLATLSDLADALAAWGNPYAEAIRAEAPRTHADLFRMELAINRLWAERARRAVRWRGRELRGVVRETLDLENAHAAIVLSRHGASVDPRACFLEGGRRLGAEAFEEAARNGNLAALSRAFAKTPFGPVLREDARSADVESDLLRARLRYYVSRARREPLSFSPLLAHLLRLRAQAIDLRRMAWARALGAPRVAAPALVSVP